MTKKRYIHYLIEEITGERTLASIDKIHKIEFDLDSEKGTTPEELFGINRDFAELQTYLQYITIEKLIIKNETLNKKYPTSRQKTYLDEYHKRLYHKNSKSDFDYIVGDFEPFEKIETEYLEIIVQLDWIFRKLLGVQRRLTDIQLYILNLCIENILTPKNFSSFMEEHIDMILALKGDKWIIKDFFTTYRGLDPKDIRYKRTIERLLPK